jgi:hypothetical protein
MNPSTRPTTSQRRASDSPANISGRFERTVGSSIASSAITASGASRCRSTPRDGSCIPGPGGAIHPDDSGDARNVADARQAYVHLKSRGQGLHPVLVARIRRQGDCGHTALFRREVPHPPH